MKKVIVIILFIISIGSLFLIYDLNKKSNSYIVPCTIIERGDNGLIGRVEKSRDSIPCSDDSDCNSEKMMEYCNPGFPDLLKCIGAKYYCGKDGKCRGYNCL
ncbi:hypothetical protein KAI56_02465 [Candidatus Parcubacteria bacterium]|nr:hypothetical protein [Candidatus Parcubacteria bacterium]